MDYPAIEVPTKHLEATMMEGLRDIIGVLMTLGLLLLIRRILFPRRPPTKHRRPFS
jgi:hypothetical protein